MYSAIAVSRCPVGVGPPHAEYNSVNVFMIRPQLRRLHVRRGKSNDIGRRILGLRDKHGERNDAAMAARLRAYCRTFPDSIVFSTSPRAASGRRVEFKLNCLFRSSV